jgi:hypothetical protein
MIDLRSCSRKSSPIVIAILVAAMIGCDGKSYREADVDGVLLIRGKPGNKLQIQFFPDADKQTVGPAAIGRTDEQGRFAMQIIEPNASSARPGAVVGWNRVVLSDMQLAASDNGRGVPIRFGPEYSTAGTTPLSQEVKEGKQTIEIRVP